MTKLAQSRQKNVPKPSATVPVTLLSGPLGAGKSNLVDAILRGTQTERIACIVNEIGKVGIDGAVLKQGRAGSRIVELSNGSICCSLHGGLHQALSDLSGLPIDRLVIEPTGEADPSPIAHSFMVEGPTREHWRLDGIVTVVDGKNFRRQREADGDLIELQLGLAHVILVNKTDLIPAGELEGLMATIAEINPIAAIYPTERSVVDCSKIFDLDAGSDARLQALTGSHHHSHKKKQWAVEVAGAVDRAAFSRWFGKEVLLNHSHRLPRSKGILNVHGHPCRIIVQGVFEQTEVTIGTPWRRGEKRTSKMVIIGQKEIVNSEELTAGFQSCQLVC